MDRRNYMTMAELARATEISLRSLFRYRALTGIGWGRYRRRFPGTKRDLYHINIIPRLREHHLRGTLRSRRRMNQGAA